MLFRTTPLADARLIDLDKHGDDRGFFARLFSGDEFESAGLARDIRQINTSLSTKAGTLRGLHYQMMPAGEVKLVRCIRGALWDVILDLRPDSATFRQWFGAELTAENRTMIYVPRGFAHGFVTLTDEAEVIYLVSHAHAPALERGIRWNDPAFAIGWPAQPTAISAKDAGWPDFDPVFHGVESLRGVR